MSDRYSTRRSFAVMVRSLRTTRSCLDLPGKVQQACRTRAHKAAPPLGGLWGGLAAVLGRSSVLAAIGKLPRLNAACRVAATCLAVFAVLGVSQTLGEPGAEPGIEPEIGDIPAQPAELTPDAVLAVFGMVRGWVDRGATPSEPVAGLPASWVTSVVIRSGGRIVGQDTAVAQNLAETKRTVQVAAERAIRRAVSRLEGEPDALRPTRLREGLARAQLSIELTPAPPVPVPEDIDLALLDDWVRQGVEGVLVAHGGGRAARTPGQMLASGRGPTASVVGMVSELAEDPAVALRPLEDLFDRGYEFSLFTVVHAAQTRPGGAPLMLHRSGHVAGPIASEADLHELAWSIAEHLMRREWPGVERHGLRGDYDPVTGRYDQNIAPPFAQAFAAEALLRYADAPGVSPERSARSRAAAEAILSALGVVERGELAPWGEPVSAAASLAALARLDKLSIDRADELRALRDRCLHTLRGAFDAKRGFDPMIPVNARGVVSRGLVAMAVFEPWDRDAHLERAGGAIRSVYRDIEPSRLLSVMPDLGWADIELARARGADPASGPALRSLRESLYDLELRAGDLVDADRDLRGGLVLDTESSPLPTWQGVRAVALLATMLGEPSLTVGTSRSGEAPGSIMRLLGMLRFLKQLAAEERIGHMYAEPGVAVGGVRASLWDQRMPLAASAVGLSAASETLASLDRLGARHEPAAGRP